METGFTGRDVFDSESDVKKMLADGLMIIYVHYFAQITE